MSVIAPEPCALDELPPLINILKGDISIVGSRPALSREVEKYNVYQGQRLYVKPRLTYYGQIFLHRNETTFSEWTTLDVRYIQECNFLTDWKIIFKTVAAVVYGDRE